MPNLEHLRRRFKPAVIRVLFVGESPPAGGTFFYQGNSNLARYTEEAFAAAYERRFKNSAAFLRFFKGLGCYLDDLCLVPVNNLERAERVEHRKAGIEPLAGRLATYRPQAVVAVMRAIEPHVQDAVRRAGLDLTPVHGLPFPALGHQPRYVRSLADLLQTMRQTGLL
jgi:hypothetical protein